MEQKSIEVPRAGLAELTRSWSGTGHLIDLLSHVQGDNYSIQWKRQDIVRRANRVLLEKMEPFILNWPSTLRQWEAFLPATALSESQISDRPRGTVNWLHTYRKFGWPPSHYLTKTRNRDFGGVAITVMGWLSKQLKDIERDVRELSSVLVDRVADQTRVLSQVVEEHSLHSEFAVPDNFEIRALASAGMPWSSISRAVELIVRSTRDPEFLAYELLEPDPKMEHDLFHLAVLGYLIASLRDHNFEIIWKSILKGSQRYPHIQAIQIDGTEWDVWFEAGSVRDHYEASPSAYQSAVKGIDYQEKSLSYDILLISPERRALILECKWRVDPQGVGREGFHQASSYALDVKNDLAEEVWAFVVGPEELVSSVSVASENYPALSVMLGSTPATRISDVVTLFFSEEIS